MKRRAKDSLVRCRRLSCTPQRPRRRGVEIGMMLDHPQDVRAARGDAGWVERVLNVGVVREQLLARLPIVRVAVPPRLRAPPPAPASYCGASSSRATRAALAVSAGSGVSVACTMPGRQAAAIATASTQALAISAFLPRDVAGHGVPARSRSMRSFNCPLPLTAIPCHARRPPLRRTSSALTVDDARNQPGRRTPGWRSRHRRTPRRRRASPATTAGGTRTGSD